jgi:hypothetical protein
LSAPDASRTLILRHVYSLHDTHSVRAGDAFGSLLRKRHQ